MKRFLGVAVLACTIFFGATCFGQKGNLVPKGGERFEKVEVPQKKQVISEAELKSNQDSLVFKAMLSKVVDKNDPAYKKMLKMPLYKRIDLLDKHIVSYQEKLDEILAIGINAKDSVVKRACEHKKVAAVTGLIEILDELKARMPEGKSKKQIEENLLGDPEVPILAAQIKSYSTSAIMSFDCLKVEAKKATNEIREPIDEVSNLFKEIIKVCESICEQTVPRHKEYLQEKYRDGKWQPGFLYISKATGKAYVQGKRGGTNNKRK